MAGLAGFDANQVPPDEGMEAVPSGKYPAAIVESEMTPTKDSKGAYLKLVFEILSGDYKGRKVWARLNLKNKSETAVKIARGQLSAICHAVGVMTPQDSVDLHNIPLVITVKCVKGQDGDMQNEIKKYEKQGAESQPLVQDADKESDWMN